MAISIEDQGSGNVIEVHKRFSVANIFVTVKGSNNRVFLNKPAHAMARNLIRIELTGNDSTVSVGAGVYIGGMLIKMLGGGAVHLGDGVRITDDLRIIMHEKSSCTIGSGSLIAAGVTFFTSDMHSVVDLATGKRLNPARSIEVCDRVWIGAAARILKGVTIGAGSIVGVGSVVAKNIPENVIVVGNPARVVKTDVTWRYELIE